MAAEPSTLTQQLNRSSTPYLDPLSRIDWRLMDTNSWWLPENAVSLYGIAAFDNLPEFQRKRLSQYEFINFIEKALWMEGIFMERISRSIGKSLGPASETLYRLHELREESGHSLMFIELIKRSGLHVEADAFHRPRLATWVGRFAPYRSMAFWIAVLIGEQVPEHMNKIIRKNRGQISELIYNVITLHAIDEARHIAHARETLDGYLSGKNHLKRLYVPMLNKVFRQFVKAFYFPTPGLYRLAGLDMPDFWAIRAQKNPHRIAFVDQCVRNTLQQLENKGLPISWR